MKCAELMKTDIECCSAQDPAELAAERMATRNVGFLPVCDGDGILIGAITDRDLAVRVLAEHRAVRTPVEELMSRELVFCSPEDELEIAESRMAEYRKSRIVCADEDGRPVGVISLSDVAQVEEGERIREVLGSIVTRETALRPRM